MIRNRQSDIFNKYFLEPFLKQICVDANLVKAVFEKDVKQQKRKWFRIL
jgi:hypothetical protein